MSIAIAGFLTGLSLIIAIGPQNAFVLRQGVRREHIAVVVALCALSDISLIAAGTYGVGALINDRPIVRAVLTWGGAAYLTWYAWTCFRSALRPGALMVAEAAPATSVAVTTLALTWLNPHVYLDTVVMIGTITNQYGEARWVNALGVMISSVAWFAALGYGARALAGPLSRPTVWRWVDAGIGVVMLLVAARLVTGH